MLNINSNIFTTIHYSLQFSILMCTDKSVKHEIFPGFFFSKCDNLKNKINDSVNGNKN